MVAEIAQLVRLYFVFLHFGKIHRAFSGTRTPGTLHDLFLAEKISGLNRVCLIGRTENHPVAQIQRQHFRFVIAKRRDKRCGGLGGGNDGCARFADHVHAIVIARAILAGGSYFLARGKTAPPCHDETEVILSHAADCPMAATNAGSPKVN